MSSGALIVISAPSGCGKTTIIRKVMQQLDALAFSVSHTTRSPRQNEVDGQHYYFTDRQKFKQIRDSQPPGFLEWAEVHGNFYGTSRSEVHKLLGSGKDVILDIDVQGARQVMDQVDAVTVFIAPPSVKELERRLRQRGTEEEQELALRLENGRAEMQHAAIYEYFIVNDILDQAVDSLCSIIKAQRCKMRRDITGNSVTVF